MLHNLGICSSYYDIKVLESSLILSDNTFIETKFLSLIQCVFDNCDYNVNTIDGLNTFHNMAGIAISGFFFNVIIVMVF